MIPGDVIERLNEDGWELDPASFRPVSGGCIHRALLGETRSGRRLFLKMNDASRRDLFEGEKLGLELLRSAKAIRLPEPFAVGEAGETAFLLMEGLDLRAGGGAGGDEKMGAQLADLHDHAFSGGKFGADFDNHIGATPQPNGWCGSWAEFFAERRLRHQFGLAHRRGAAFSPGEIESTLEAVRDTLDRRSPEPSLLHGDLWGGNAAFDERGEPVLFDPAAYHGDAEADIAFTRVFGGFGPGFYRACRERRPAPPDVEELHTIYNLYHLLNHYVIFGGGYRAQAGQAMRRIRES